MDDVAINYYYTNAEQQTTAKPQCHMTIHIYLVPMVWLGALLGWTDLKVRWAQPGQLDQNGSAPHAPHPLLGTRDMFFPCDWQSMQEQSDTDKQS